MLARVACLCFLREQNASVAVWAFMRGKKESVCRTDRGKDGICMSSVTVAKYLHISEEDDDVKKAGKIESISICLEIRCDFFLFRLWKK